MSEDFCVFCALVKRLDRAGCIYEDDTTLAFLDDRPAAEGHTLVIPKKHYAAIYDIPDKEVAHLFEVVKKVAVAVKKSINPDGIRIIQRNGKAAGQHIFHLHVHVIPRHEEQRLPRMEEIPLADKEELDAVAQKLRSHL